MQDGILAGGMADGTIGLWNPGRIARAGTNGGEEGTPVATMRTHKGAVRRNLHSCLHAACDAVLMAAPTQVAW